MRDQQNDFLVNFVKVQVLLRSPLFHELPFLPRLSNFCIVRWSYFADRPRFTTIVNIWVSRQILEKACDDFASLSRFSEAARQMETKKQRQFDFFLQSPNAVSTTFRPEKLSPGNCSPSLKQHLPASVESLALRKSRSIVGTALAKVQFSDCVRAKLSSNHVRDLRRWINKCTEEDLIQLAFSL